MLKTDTDKAARVNLSRTLETLSSAQRFTSYDAPWTAYEAQKIF